MFKTLIYWIRTVIQKVFGKDTVKQAAGVEVQISSRMAAAIELWENMYLNTPPWASDTVAPIGLPAAIASEFARLITVEMKAAIEGSPRAKWIDEQFSAETQDLQSQVEQGLALGGMAFKPYITGTKMLAVDFTPADRFLPTAYSGRHITGAVFVDRQTSGKWYYTRFEHHDLVGTTYTVRNVAYMSTDAKMLGVQVPLGQVNAWAGLQEEITLGGIARPLFGYFRVPAANNIDRGSPLGTSVYARSVPLIQQADEQWARILWELEGTELAIDISDRAFKLDEKTGDPIVPHKQARLFRPAALGDMEKPLYQVFSPAIRTSPYFDAFNGILRRIEFNCNLAYGTISDPQNVDKTAEEIRSSKQRSYSAVSSMQRALQSALDGLVYAMDAWATIGGLAPAGAYKTAFEWGDGINDDPEKEFAQRMQLVAAGVDRPDEMRQWFHGETPEEAIKNLPQALDGGGFGDDGGEDEEE